MRVLIIIFCITIIGCNNYNYTSNLYNYISNNYHPLSSSKKITLIIVDDKDCQTCFQSFNKHNVEGEVIGFYSSKYPNSFIEQLVRVNDNIVWVNIEYDKVFYNQLFEKYNQHGPYIVQIENGKILNN